MAYFRVEHRIGVPAPPHVVWEVISNLAGWAGWNPLYVKAEGQLRIGGQLTIHERWPSTGREDVIQPKVVDWVPDNQILWRLPAFRGWVQRLRYIEIDKLTDEGCIFSNGEDWSGFFTRYVPAARRREMYDGFTAFGEAVREQSVRLWKDRGGNPILEAL